MRARLVKTTDGSLALLYSNGSISNPDPKELLNFLLNFKQIHLLGASEEKWSDKYHDMTFYPGETVAFVSDSGQLVVLSIDPFVALLNADLHASKYLTATEYAKKYNKSVEIIKVYCRDGRILGATKKGNAWIIPEDAPYPTSDLTRRKNTQNFHN